LNPIGVPLTIDSHVRGVPFQLECVPQSLAADLIEAFELRRIDMRTLRIAAQTESTQFSEERKEASRALQQTRDRHPPSQQKHVPVPVSAPKERELSLAERLRFILMPSLDELLRDPQLVLPFEPFLYQKEGIAWLLGRENALLADEMGLGKTMQAIVAARLLWRQRQIERVLVVCPKSLIGNWRREIELWWPQMSEYTQVCGADRQFFMRLATKNTGIKLINYEALAREVDWLVTARCSHDLVIIDEAQRIKNPESKTARAVKALKSMRRWALTGTPLENKIEDVISIFEFIYPGLLKSNDPCAVRSAIAPHMLRRQTEDVLTQLPKLIDQDISLDLGPNQRAAYDRAERQKVAQLNAMGDSITITHVFQLITYLRQLCNFEPTSNESAKLDLLTSDLEDITASGRKALVFSQFTNEQGIGRIEQELQDYSPLALHGKIPPSRRDAVVQEFQNSSKVRVLLLNYAVGGVGLNLHAANYVYLFDRWWNPAVEDQAIKRAHRLGQKERVFVRRFICRGTIEERICKILSQKRRLFQSVVDEGHPETSLGLTEEEVFSLFDLRVRPRRKAQATEPVSLILENIDPQQFEVLVSRIYEAQGYSVSVQGASHDGGIDIVAERRMGSARERVVIQCKRQQAAVGRPVLQQLWGVVNSDPLITRGDCVTSSRFSAEARGFAADKRLTLIDKPTLERLARELKVAHFVHSVTKPERGTDTRRADAQRG
jgi:SNF2 family DNA or RNA helicase